MVDVVEAVLNLYKTIRVDKGNRDKVAAVVVTYNRKELLGISLESLLEQTRPIDAIFIIDNASTDGTPEYLVDKGFIDNPVYPDQTPLEETKTIPLLKLRDKSIKIRYIRMHQNTGGAGGFHEGVKRACAEYNWLWLMDDDVKADERCLENLLEKNQLIEKQTQEAPVALACARFYLDNQFAGGVKKILRVHPFFPVKNNITNHDLDKDYFKVDGTAFEGLFFNSICVEQIGLPDRRLFIYGDDIDYCLRLLTLGNMYYIPSAKLTRLVKEMCQKGIRLTWKYPYIVRNTFYLDLTYSAIHYKFLRISYHLLRFTIEMVCYLDFQNMLIIIKSLFDAIKMYRENYDTGI